MTSPSLGRSGRRVALILIACVPALIGFGCSRSDDGVPPPQAASAAAPQPIGEFVNMTDANAKEYFVRDIIPDLQANAWRWVNKRPEMRFHISNTQNLKFVMEFAIPDVTLKDTGPVSITYYVNDHVLDKVSYPTAGNMTFEKPVPADWLVANGPNVVAAEVDKPWVSPKDKTRLGFILVRAGFRPSTT